MPNFRSSFVALAAALLVRPAAAAAQQPAPDTTRKTDTTQKAPKPKPPLLDFSGWVFGNYQMETDDAAKAANGGSSVNRFDLERAYLTFKMPAGNRASARVTTDIKQGQSASGAYQGWFVRLKYAYLQYDYVQPTASGFSALARVGMLHTVLIDHEESVWPRWVSKTATDRVGFFSSADLGVATQLTLPNRLGEIYGTITNGSGYENPEANRFKDVALRLSLTPFGSSSGYFTSFTISPWGYLGQNASAFVHDPTNPISSGLAKNRYGLFAGITDRRAMLGAEWAERKDASDSGSAGALDRVVTTTTGRLYDAFAVLRPLEWGSHGAEPSVGLLARYDHFTPNTAAAGYQEFLVGGVFWDLTPEASLSFDYQKTTPKNGLGGNPTELWYVHWQVRF